MPYSVDAERESRRCHAAAGPSMSSKSTPISVQRTAIVRISCGVHDERTKFATYEVVAIGEHELSYPARYSAWMYVSTGNGSTRTATTFWIVTSG